MNKDINTCICELTDAIRQTNIVNSDLYTYSTKELATMLHVHENTISMYREMGILKGMRTGKYYVYPKEEVKKFIEKYNGCDISNRLKIKQLNNLWGGTNE